MDTWALSSIEPGKQIIRGADRSIDTSSCSAGGLQLVVTLGIAELLLLLFFTATLFLLARPAES